MEVLITSEAEKLPEGVRVLLDESRPLPAGIAFFEERFTPATLAQRLFLGLALLAGCLLAVAGGVWMLVDDIRHPTVSGGQSSRSPAWWVMGFGAVLGLAGWMMLASLRAAWANSRRQSAGGHTRLGVYLLANVLVHHNSFDTTIIPRECFRGLAAGAVRYEHAGQEKSFSLPMEMVGATSAQRDAAILAWSQLPNVP